MTFDSKKEYKEFYMPKNKPEIANIPKANHIAVRGKGNPTSNMKKGGIPNSTIPLPYYNTPSIPALSVD